MGEVRRCVCGSTRTLQLITPASVHYGAEICAVCRRHLRWLPKPDGERVRRPAAHRELVEKYSQGYCELCLTKQEDLPARQTLEAHHVVEFQDGGSAQRSNVWIVCTACAKLIHWARTWGSKRTHKGGGPS